VDAASPPPKGLGPVPISPLRTNRAGAFGACALRARARLVLRCEIGPKEPFGCGLAESVPGHRFGLVLARSRSLRSCRDEARAPILVCPRSLTLPAERNTAGPVAPSSDPHGKGSACFPAEGPEPAVEPTGLCRRGAKAPATGDASA